MTASDHLARCKAHELKEQVVTAVAHRPRRERKTGEVLIAAEVAREYGFTDVDGRQPSPICD